MFSQIINIGVTWVVIPAVVIYVIYKLIIKLIVMIAPAKIEDDDYEEEEEINEEEYLNHGMGR